MGVENFFPAEGGSLKPATMICQRCIVSSECLSFALANPSLKGVWAGTSERRRRAIRMGNPALSPHDDL